MKKVRGVTGVQCGTATRPRYCGGAAVTLFSARALKAVQCELAHFGLAAANMRFDAGKCSGGVAGADGVENRAMFLIGLVETIAVYEIEPAHHADAARHAF